MQSSALDALKAFLDTPLDERLAHPEEGVAERVLAHFKQTVEQVPAYRAWLAEQGVDAAAVTSTERYADLPLTTKPGYVLRYPLEQRCPDGVLDDALTMAVSTGSTGNPVIWPRALRHELDMTFRFEQVFGDAFAVHQKRSLAVVCFSLGNWVGGMFTVACCRHLKAKGYRISVATPGSDPPEIFRVIEQLGPRYEQVILLGYPPFIKDVLDQGRARGIDWPALSPKLVFAGEVFSESWRDIVCRQIGAPNPSRATASLYGTADGGVLGTETALTITVRRWLAERPEVARQLFGDPRLPTLVQYDPRSRYFEQHEGTLVISGDNGAPLVRYHIADRGGLMPFGDFMAKLREAGFDAGVHALAPMRQMPFVWVFGRADFTVSYYGANIYPENVKLGLEQPDTSPYASGKFVMFVEEDKRHDHRLAIVVELLPKVAPDEPRRAEIAAAFADAIVKQLLRKNSEFAHYVPEARRTPRIELRAHADPEWFPAGIKHRYTR